MYIRLPRVLAAALAGAALAVSGAVIQSVLGNPLAAPNIIGVNAGAGLFTVLCMALFPAAVKMLPAAAFLGALFAVMTVYGIAKKTGASRMTIVLTGIGVSSLLNAVIDTVTNVFPDSLAGISSFKAGSISVGDEIPTRGESYGYPDSFDIIVLRDGISVKVRDRRITEIIPTADYSYGGVPVVNGRGFGVKASSDEEIK